MANCASPNTGETENVGILRAGRHLECAHAATTDLIAHNSPQAIAVEAASPVPTEECQVSSISLYPS